MAKRDDEKKPVATGQEQTPQAGQQTPPLESDQPAQPPAADQQAQTATADATTIGALHEMIMVVGDQTAGLAQALAALAERVAALEVQPGAIGEPVPVVLSITSSTPPQIEFDPAWLEGLVFKGARRKDGQGNAHEPFERKARRSDVLKWSVDGDEVVIVLADGSKHRVGR